MIGIVDLHENAKIWAESEGEGKGCTFFVRVPVNAHRALDVLASQEPKIHAILSVASLSDPIHDFTQVELSPESCQLALAAVALIRNSSENETNERLSLQLPTSPVVSMVLAPVWKPTILVVDDSSMNRKVNP